MVNIKRLTLNNSILLAFIHKSVFGVVSICLCVCVCCCLSVCVTSFIIIMSFLDPVPDVHISKRQVISVTRGRVVSSNVVAGGRGLSSVYFF